MSGGGIGGGSCGSERALTGRPRRLGALLAAVWDRLRSRWARRTRAALPAIWQATLDQTASFHPAPTGLRLTCRAGCFLVTQAADPDDHVLEAGDTFEAAPRGKLVAWALGAGTLEVLGLRRARPHVPDPLKRGDRWACGRAAPAARGRRVA